MKLVKHKKQIAVALAVLILLACTNITLAMYNPNTGRFNRMDPFTGNKEKPQSLHKYVYVHNNPINRVDPTGRFATMTELNVSTAIQAQIQASIGASVITSYHLYQAAQGIDRALIEREIKLFVQTHATPGTFTQQEFQRLEDMIRVRTRGRGVNLYLHYGYEKDMVSLLGGLWPISPRNPEGSFATRTVYPTGWHAKWFLAIKWKEPPDSVYIPKPGFGPTRGPEPVIEKPDETGRLMGGNGWQYIFGKGSGGPGTVFGPIPIPKGEFIW